jgi:hypothetical protein
MFGFLILNRRQVFVLEMGFKNLLNVNYSSGETRGKEAIEETQT